MTDTITIPVKEYIALVRKTEEYRSKTMLGMVFALCIGIAAGVMVG